MIEEIKVVSLASLLIKEKNILNITSRELAERIGISEVSISMYINGMFPNQTRNLKKIAMYFNMSMEELEKLRLD